jgi:hypothetical protein
MQLWLVYTTKGGAIGSSCVLLKDSHVVYIHAHLIQVVKFLVPPKDHKVSGNDGVYELTRDTLSSIRSVIASLEDD